MGGHRKMSGGWLIIGGGRGQLLDKIKHAGRWRARWGCGGYAGKETSLDCVPNEPEPGAEKIASDDVGIFIPGDRSFCESRRQGL